MLPLPVPDEAEEDASAEMVWASGAVRGPRVAVPALFAALGVACVMAANGASIRGVEGTQPWWWLGVLAIFVPAAAVLLGSKVSRAEAALILVITGAALYAVKLAYAPGRFWEFDELLHYPTVDALLTTRRLFTPNSLLPVSPYYPGLEIVTAVLVQLTGLSIVEAGLVVIGVARVLTVTALFLLFERTGAPPRFTAAATLLYMACPAFLYFDAQFAYESLAVALALACLFALRAAQLETRSRRRHLKVLGAALLLAVVVTHHVTSFALVTALVAWTLCDLVLVLRERARAGAGLWFDTATDRPLVYLVDLPGGAWVPILGVWAVGGWMLGVAWERVSYLWPHLLSGVAELARIIRLAESGRRLFESNAGHTAPVLERAAGIGSVLVIVVLIPVGFRYLWERREHVAFARFLALGSLAYPVTLALRFTRSGWELASRATAFVYVPLAVTLAAGLYVLAPRLVRGPRARAALVVAVATLVFVGGIVAVTSPTTRQPAPYDPGLAWVPYDAESIAAARWADRVLGPGNRFAADSAGGLLLGSVGRQHVVASEEGESVSYLFLSTGFEDRAQEVARRLDIDYVMVDRRIAGSEPLKGYIYEKWERDIVPYGSSVSSTTVDKFSVQRDANRVFDSGSIQYYDLGRLLR